MDTQELLQQLSVCVERGKIDKQTPYPPDMNGMDGASELTLRLIEAKVNPEVILNEGLVPGMNRIGVLYGEGKAFVPSLLTSAKAMNAATDHLKPFFASGAIKRKGKFIIGTVLGDLHDIGKNLVGYAMEGAGWEVIDLGTDVSAEKFVEALRENPGAVIGMSALLTITMVNMKEIVDAIRKENPDTKIFIGGAPITQDFCDEIKADFYSPDPHHAVVYLQEAV